MKVFVVRLNPDTRSGPPYSKYPTLNEYRNIHKSSPMDGFQEAVNFLSENGVVRGYLPPKHLRSMRSSEPFILVTITAKTAKTGGDMVVGIQAGCRYKGATLRLSGPKVNHDLDLYWHYSCGESLSLLLPQQLPNARNLILGKVNDWVRGPTKEISASTFRRVCLKAGAALTSAEDKAKLDLIVKTRGEPIRHEGLDIENESEFDEQVASVLESDLGDVPGNEFPAQISALTFRYQRDPAVAAYALQRARGVCADCKKNAPFVSNRTGLPYLEIHHVRMLRDGGSDTVDNVVALCPNCHRKRHYG